MSMNFQRAVSTSSLIILFSALLVSRSALAEEFGDAWKFSVGVGLEDQPARPGGSEHLVSSFPLFRAANDHYFIGQVPTVGPTGVGLYLLHDEHWRIGAGLGENIASNTEQTALAFAFANYSEKYLTVTSNVKSDVGGHGQGHLLSMDILGRYKINALVLYAGPGFTWASTAYAQKYFGVNASQNDGRSSGAYNAGAGINSLRIRFGASYYFMPHWDIGAQMKLGHLQGDAAASPRTASVTQNTFGIFTNYRF